MIYQATEMRICHLQMIRIRNNWMVSFLGWHGVQINTDCSVLISTGDVDSSVGILEYNDKTKHSGVSSEGWERGLRILSVSLESDVDEWTSICLERPCDCMVPVKIGEFRR